MNLTAAIALVDESVRAVKVVFDSGHTPDGEVGWSFKTRDSTIKEGDFVVVTTAYSEKANVGYKVAKVVEVNAEFAFDSDIKYRWVVARLDTTEYEKTLDEEKRAIEVIRKAELRKRRVDLAKALISDSIRAEIKTIVGRHAFGEVHEIKD